MGTPCLTRVFNDKNEILVVLERSSNGAPHWHGSELAEFLNGINLGGNSKGFSFGQPTNGMEELAARLIVNFKKRTGCGEFYIRPASYVNTAFTYDITVEDKTKLKVKVSKNGEVLFDGYAGEFNMSEILNDPEDPRSRR